VKPNPDPLTVPEDACTDPDARPELDRANRERARDLALTCLALLAILAIVLWWTQR
jgi:hypothetical protein